MIENQKYGLEVCGLYYGKYKAQVTSNSDPENVGRLQLSIPQVHGPDVAPIWARPSAVGAGKNSGFWWIPDVGEWVYVTFDHGRAEFPVWESGWWAENNDDTTDDMVPSKVVITVPEGMKIVIDRSAGTVLVQQSSGNSVEVSATEVKLQSTTKITLSAPDIELEGNVNVTGNLNVTEALTATIGEAHHIHLIGPNPLDPTQTIALRSIP